MWGEGGGGRDGGVDVEFSVSRVVAALVCAGRPLFLFFPFSAVVGAAVRDPSPTLSSSSPLLSVI